MNALRRSQITVRRAMTLVEILAVVVILGLVAGISIVGFGGMFETAKHETAKSAIAVVVERIEAYNIATGDYPSDEEGLSVLTSAAPTAPYFLTDDATLDPWNRPFEYIRPGTDGMPYEVVTFGKDGVTGGDDANTDLSSASLRDDAS